MTVTTINNQTHIFDGDQLIARLTEGVDPAVVTQILDTIG